ncbi:hypothetical protein [Albimonas pacifica]|uniref:Uncharacterized protein n=1 Tax=Albimonas pacifica TaxID=1114924 RepID=A0A1I3LG66_9RHOB|nr:hypothetical protein [Albimonas pacifica]SFI83753.1 hypothetical protein SAMN05216258_11012 [Albimonas pacifica]
MSIRKPNQIAPAVLGEGAAGVHRRYRDYHNAEADRFTALADECSEPDEWWKHYRDEAVRHRLLAWECETELALLSEMKEAA